MRVCNACHVSVRTGADYCPLCGNVLEGGQGEVQDEVSVPAVNHYPDLTSQMKQYNFFRRILLFITIFGCLFSALVNVLVTPGIWWSLIVLAVAIYCWALLPALLRKGTNYARQIVFQVVLTCAIVIAADFITGYRGWSVSYVLPGVLSAGIVATGLMAIFNRTRWSQYVFYQVIVCVFGFAPLVLYLTGIAHSLVMVLVTVGLAMASLLLAVIFGDRTIKNEFIKRFHV
ncbi:DUF6320 domain-containing protein [Ruminococcaceae bacterium OttesenSCG-928-I18]|nr:DUF6320 domain-containing protein [Ruminococcaceae bacterium OttesenSCG-928-I18]